MHKDALGNPIIVGNIYGYSNRSNGVLTVIIGKATRLNKTTITLEILKRGKSIYDDDTSFENSIFKNNVSVISNSIFPLATAEVNWVNEDNKSK